MIRYRGLLFFSFFTCLISLGLSSCPVNVTCSSSTATSCSTFCNVSSSKPCTLCDWDPSSGVFYECWSGKCLNLACTSDLQCIALNISTANATVAFCDTQMGFCRVRAKYGSTSDLCASNTDCLSNNCTNGTCGGTAAGRSCIASSEANPCFYGGFCDPGYDYNCNDLRTVGQQCTSPDMCATSLCGAQTSISPSTYCLQRYGKTMQMYCGSGLECQSGYCNQTNACGDASYSFNLTVNAEVACSQNYNCTDLDAVCNPMTCQCDNPNATVALDCTDLEEAQYGCLMNAQCPYESDPMKNTSCAFVNCGNEIACYQACLYGPSSPAAGDLFSSCGWQTHLQDVNSPSACPAAPATNPTSLAVRVRPVMYVAALLCTAMMHIL